jgi:hypothetical protein
MNKSLLLMKLRLASLLFVFFLGFSIEKTKAQFFSSPPTIDGTTDASYVTSGSWSLGWDDTYLYVRYSGGGGTEPVILHLDIDPQTPVSGGTNSNGSLTGQANWDITPTLPFRSDFQLYWENQYAEYRTDNGSGGWSGTTVITTANRSNSSGTEREIRIAWTTMGAGSRPSSFNWFGYANSRANPGFMFNEMPSENPSGAIFTPRINFYYTVSNTTNSGTTSPFARTCMEQRSGNGDLFVTGNLTVYDLTNNANNVNDEIIVENVGSSATLQINGSAYLYGGLVANQSDIVQFNSGSGAFINANGFITTNTSGVINYNSSNTTLTYQTAGTYNSSGEWPSTNSPTSITVTNNTTVNLTSARTLTSTLTVNSGSTFNSGGNLTITGPGRIGNSGGTIGGNISLEISMSSGRRAFRLLSFPFSTARSLADISDDIHVTGTGGATNGFDATTTNASSAFTFTESGFNGTTNTGWSGIASTSASIPANQPIRVLYRGPRSQGSTLLEANPPSPLAGTIDYTGTVNQGNVNITLSYTGANGGNAGWNLIPNPYPSNVDFGSIASGSRNGIGTFAEWVVSSGTRGSYVSRSFGSSHVIAKGSAVFVQTGSAATFTITEADKTASSASSTLLKTNPFLKDAMQINVYSDDTIFWDQFVFRSRPDETEGKDNSDAPKMLNPDVNFYSLSSSNDKLAIDNRPIADGKVIPLGFATGSPYHFTFKMGHFSLPEYKVYLKDKFLNTVNEISNEDFKYDFVTTADALSQGENRFELIFSKSATGLNAELSSSNNFIVFPNPANNVLNLSLTTTKEDNYNFTIYNQLGAEVNAGNLDFNAKRTHALNIENLSNGVYFIQVKNGKTAQTIKFIK